MAHRKMPKKPKKPRQSASVQVWERYGQRYKDWQSKCSKITSDVKKKETLIKRFAKC